jgi:hypothetical protein
MSRKTGIVRSDLNSPPGPIVSPMHWSTPYFSGMSLSQRTQSTPETSMQLTR